MSRSGAATPAPVRATSRSLLGRLSNHESAFAFAFTKRGRTRTTSGEEIVRPRTRELMVTHSVMFRILDGSGGCRLICSQSLLSFISPSYRLTWDAASDGLLALEGGVIPS